MFFAENARRRTHESEQAAAKHARVSKEAVAKHARVSKEAVAKHARMSKETVAKYKHVASESTKALANDILKIKTRQKHHPASQEKQQETGPMVSPREAMQKYGRFCGDFKKSVQAALEYYRMAELIDGKLSAYDAFYLYGPGGVHSLDNPNLKKRPAQCRFLMNNGKKYCGNNRRSFGYCKKHVPLI